jgi:hypothetical protein
MGIRFERAQRLGWSAPLALVFHPGLDGLEGTRIPEDWPRFDDGRRRMPLAFVAHIHGEALESLRFHSNQVEELRGAYG